MEKLVGRKIASVCFAFTVTFNRNIAIVNELLQFIKYNSINTAQLRTIEFLASVVNCCVILQAKKVTLLYFVIHI